MPRNPMGSRSIIEGFLRESSTRGRSVADLAAQLRGISPASSFLNKTPSGEQPLDFIDTASAPTGILHHSMLAEYSPGNAEVVGFEHPGQRDKGFRYWKEKIANGERPAILIGGERNLKIYDGNHRAAAYKELEIEEIPVLFTDKARRLLGRRQAGTK